MKRIICVLLAHVFVVVVLFSSYALADYNEDILYVIEGITNECSDFFGDDRTFGWELISDTDSDAMYSLYIFEEFVKTEYAFDFWKSEDGQSITGVVVFMFLDEDNLIEGYLPTSPHYFQMKDVSTPFIKSFARHSGLSEEGPIVMEYHSVVMTCCGKDRSESVAHIGADNSYLGIDFSKDLNALRLCFYFGDPKVNNTDGALPFTEKYRSSSIYPSVVQKFSSEEKVEEYLAIYDAIWGDLYSFTGKIIYETLTEQQRSLIHFPAINVNSVYFTKDGRSYHSTKHCYTLLNSKSLLSSSLQEAIRQGKTSGCSKCVK